jgi:hypothetical protein
MSTRFAAGWIGSVILANVVTVIAATIIQTESAPAILVVATLEGICLGVVQRALLRGRRPELACRWILVTLAGTLLARAIQFVAETGPLMELSYRLPVGLQYVSAIAAGLLIGAVMAIPQALVLHRWARTPVAWLFARGAGTAFSFAWLLAAQRSFGAIRTDLITVFLLLLVVFAIAGAVSGAIEAAVLSRLLTRRPRRSDSAPR